MNTIAILANNGESPPKILKDYRSFIALDGAANTLRETNIAPNIILGDLDSIENKTREFFSSAKVVHLPDQNKTDLEKGLEYCLKAQNPSEIHIFNAIGSRSDHSLANLTFLRKFHTPKIPIRLFTKQETLSFYKDTDISLSKKVTSPLALMGFPSAIVSSNGLLYDMNETQLDFFSFNSVCNSFREKNVFIKIQGEALLIEALT